MIYAVPLEEHLSGLDVQLLDDALPGYAILGASDGRMIPWHRVVDREQRCVLRAYEELVVVPVVAVGSPEPGYLAVGAVEDHVLALVLARCLHPSEHGFAPVGLNLEVHRPPIRVLQRTEPHHPAAIVDDQRAALPHLTLLRGHKDVALGCVVRFSYHLHDWWA